MLYLIVKWLHVVLAIAAVGTNLTYGIWLARAARSPQALAFTLRGVKVLDDRVANPAYGLLLVTGLALAYLGGWSFRAPWIMIALTLYVIAIVLGVVAYGPTLRRQIALVEAGQQDSPAYAALAGRGRTLGIILAVLVIAIVFMMVVKPGS